MDFTIAIKKIPEMKKIEDLRFLHVECDNAEIDFSKIFDEASRYDISRKSLQFSFVCKKCNKRVWMPENKETLAEIFETLIDGEKRSIGKGRYDIVSEGYNQNKMTEGKEINVYIL